VTNAGAAPSSHAGTAATVLPGTVAAPASTSVPPAFPVVVPFSLDAWHAPTHARRTGRSAHRPVDDGRGVAGSAARGCERRFVRSHWPGRCRPPQAAGGLGCIHISALRHLPLAAVSSGLPDRPGAAAAASRAFCPSRGAARVGCTAAGSLVASCPRASRVVLANTNQLLRARGACRTQKGSVMTRLRSAATRVGIPGDLTWITIRRGAPSKAGGFVRPCAVRPSS
jgi:hypothetical protein